VREHVDECAECRAKIAQAQGNAAVVGAFIDPEPDEQELVLFAAGKLPTERAAEIEAHLVNCIPCREAVEDLRPFAAPSNMVEMPARRRPVPLWWGAVAAVLLVGVYGVWQSGKPEVFASLNDSSGTVALTRSGEVIGLAGVDEQERTLIAQVLRTGQMPLNVPTGAPQNDVLRGPADNQPIRLLDPIARRTLSDRPELRWGSVEGVSSYEVTVFTEDEHIVARSTVAEPRWQPEAGLPRGARLYWQVSGMRGSERLLAPIPPAPRAWFETVSAETTERLEKLRNSGASDLRLTVAYARQGLRVEAASALNNLATRNPDSPLVKQLRDSLLQK